MIYIIKYYYTARHVVVFSSQIYTVWAITYCIIFTVRFRLVDMILSHSVFLKIDKFGSQSLRWKAFIKMCCKSVSSIVCNFSKRHLQTTKCRQATCRARSKRFFTDMVLFQCKCNIFEKLYYSEVKHVYERFMHI